MELTRPASRATTRGPNLRKVKSLFRVRSAADWRVGATLVLVGSLLTISAINTCVSNMTIKGEPLPEYATWTGIPTLERKLQILRQFAKEGPVDAMLIGASVADHGISAALLSQELSVAYGRPFRVFNFSTGGAEAPTIT